MFDGALTPKDVRSNGWNEARVVARGPHMTFTINGRMTSVVIDQELTKLGIIGLQLHAGHPLKVQFRDLRIRR